MRRPAHAWNLARRSPDPERGATARAGVMRLGFRRTTSTISSVSSELERADWSLRPPELVALHEHTDRYGQTFVAMELVLDGSEAEPIGQMWLDLPMNAYLVEAVGWT